MYRTAKCSGSGDDVALAADDVDVLGADGGADDDERLVLAVEDEANAVAGLQVVGGAKDSARMTSSSRSPRSPSRGRGDAVDRAGRSRARGRR